MTTIVVITPNSIGKISPVSKREYDLRSQYLRCTRTSLSAMLIRVILLQSEMTQGVLMC